MIHQWILTVTFTVKYLINIDAQATKWKIHYVTVTLTATTHELTECSYTKLADLATGATEMILCNYVLYQ